MENFRKFITRLLSVTLAAVMSLFAVGGSAFAEDISYKWMVDMFSIKQEQSLGWRGNGNTKFSVDDKVHTDNSWYSIKLENTDYNVSNVERTYDVEPYTTYRFSAMVKYSGYVLSPDAKYLESGATIGEHFSHVNSGFTTSSNWTFMEYEFTTGNETTHTLALQNGIYWGDCKGTAWFSDVKLEKVEMTNSWNILVLFFKNVDATLTLNGKTVHHKTSVTEAKINEINTYCLDKLPTLFRDLSNNKMTVNSIDRYFIDEAVTEKDFAPYKKEGVVTGFCIDTEISELMHKTFDKYLAQKHYNQIIVFYPIDYMSGGWFGLGGTEYKGAGTAQINSGQDTNFEKGDRFQGQVAVHEICHGLANRSKAINGKKTPDFHDILNEYTKQYPSSPDISAYERIHQYMNCTLPDGRGLDPSVFNVTSGKYTLVSDDMTTGAGIEPGSSSVAPPAPKNLKVEAVGDEKVKITWGTVPKASGYQLVLFKDPGFNEIRNTFDIKSDQNYAHLVYIKKGVPYYYGVRTTASVNGVTVYSDWTTLTYTHEGVEVVRGDVDNNGYFDFNDVNVALNYFLNDIKIDDRTAKAMGISGRYILNFDDVQLVLEWFLRG